MLPQLNVMLILQRYSPHFDPFGWKPNRLIKYARGGSLVEQQSGWINAD